LGEWVRFAPSFDYAGVSSPRSVFSDLDATAVILEVENDDGLGEETNDVDLGV